MSGLYKLYKSAIFTNGWDNSVSDGTVKAMLVEIGGGNYVVDLDAHATVDDIGPSNIIATSDALASPSGTLGVFNADPITLTAVTGGPVGALVLFFDTGDGTDNHLLAYIDGVTGLPATFAGGNVTITWDTGANKIFVL